MFFDIEENPKIEETNEESVKTIQLVRYKWKDEVENDRKKRQNRLRTLVFIFGALVIGIVFGVSLGDSKGIDYEKYSTIEKILKNKWYFGKDIDNLSDYLLDLSLKGMTDFEVDPHTEYLTVSETSSWINGLADNFVGIGVQYYNLNNQFIIKKVYQDSPAEAAGVLPGDIIISVNGDDIVGISSEELVSLIKGETGTNVKVGVHRQGNFHEFNIIRGSVTGSVYSTIIDDEIAYLEISQFAENTASEVDRVLLNLSQKDKLIIDLRDNGGGYLSTVSNIASFFLDTGEKILIQEDKSGSRDITYAEATNKYFFDQVIILVNENTASASEVLTAALSQGIGASVVGVNTYGKGTVQQTQTLADGSALKYTVAQWLAPDGTVIHNVGIKPDYEVKLHDVLYLTSQNMEEDRNYTVDSVGNDIKTVQLALNFLGYFQTRTDGYLDSNSLSILNQFLDTIETSNTDIINKDIYQIVISEVIRQWHSHQSNYDLQMNKAIELMK